MENIIIKKNCDKRLFRGHLWVFSNEIKEIKQIPAGTIVSVVGQNGKDFGTAFYNPNSLIALRMLNSNSEPDKEFFKERIEKADNLRKDIFPDEKMYRLVYGESDFLPGLIIDKYDEYFVLQILSAGMEKCKDKIISALLELFPTTSGIIEKSQSQWRIQEGLEIYEDILFGVIPEVFEAEENGIKLNLSLEKGQKTGWFLDQKLNRKFIRSISKGKKVLDCYTNQGGFALNAAFAGAEKVEGIDSSEAALSSANKNAMSNNFKNIEFIKADVPAFMEMQLAQGVKYDVIILDPPAFAKSKKHLPTAMAAYSKINKNALKLLNQGGYLVSSSCSQHLEEAVYYELIVKEAAKLGLKLRLLHRGMQAPDHPILASMPETDYLKFFVFKTECLNH